MIPLFFSNENVHYSRWLSVHFFDMISLGETHPEIEQEFQNGHFVLHKTKREFSGLAFDHAHEQNNALVKSDGGAIGITEKPSAFFRWMTAGPEV